MSKQFNEVTFESRDEYQRKPVAEKIINLLKSDAQVSPMIIDGGWGTGKTEFCYKLIHLIEKGETNIKAVYVDAFSADHADEPLMTLLAAIVKLLPESERPGLIQKALPAVRFGIKTTLKAGVSWLLKQDTADIADDFDKDLKKAGDDAINQTVESLLTDHIDAEESIATLKKALKELSTEMPIVIFVDELDRCRPDFSVSMLESIKHIFDVDGVQFVLVTNTNQLRASINHCYGASIDSQRYLDKFIGFSFILPQTYKPDRYTPVLASVGHLVTLLESSELLNNSGLVKRGAIDFLKKLVKKNNLSLREVETFVRHLEIYHTLADGKGFVENIIFGYCLLRIIGVFMFCFKENHADVLVNGFVDAPFIVGLMGKSRLVDLKVNHPDNEDILTALIGFETSVNVDDYKPATEEIRLQWNRSINSFFQGGGFPPETGERTKIINAAIETLKLSE